MTSSPRTTAADLMTLGNGLCGFLAIGVLANLWIEPGDACPGVSKARGSGCQTIAWPGRNAAPDSCCAWSTAVVTAESMLCPCAGR